MGEELRPLVGDTVSFLHEATAAGKTILFEGAQGSLLDADFGTYPFNTSSNSTVGGMVTGSGLPPKQIGRVVGILKAYTTRVGSGPFPTELEEEIGALLRANGNEFGATTGRPRRCGWFDAVAARYSTKINGTDEFAITKLDVLDGINPLKICVAYEIDGQRTETFPGQIDKLAAAKPIYEEIAGWDGSSTSDESASGLCPAAEAYIARISSLAGAPATIISVGSDRDQTLTR
jgi:adenylosuccinate synthase